MIDILHLIDTYRIGGPGKTIINSARFIDRSKYRIHVAAFTRSRPVQSEFACAILNADIPFLELPDTRGVRPAHVRILRAYLRNNGIDILHSHGYRADVLALLSAVGLHRTRLVTTHHGWIRNGFRQHVLTRLAKHLSACFDGVEVVSSSMLRQLPRWLRSSPRVSVVRNGILLRDYRESGQREAVRSRFRVASSDVLLGVIGRLSPEKGCLDVLEAFRLKADAFPNLQLLFVGEGPLETTLRRRVAQAGLVGRTHFVGHQVNICPFYEASDVIVSPSHTEGLSNVLLEAMAFGRPVIATRVGGSPEIVEDLLSGLLVEPHSPAALSIAIARLVQDDEVRDTVARGGYQRVQEIFRFESRIAEEQRFYERVLASAGRHSVAGLFRRNRRQRV